MKYLKEALKESELLNVVDESGEYDCTDSGHIRTVARGPAHKYGVLHQTSNILAVVTGLSETMVILQKRAPDKDIFPGALTVLCGGHMGTAVDPKKAVLREAMEELHLSIAPDRLIQLGPNKGCRNLLREWTYAGTKVIQMGRSAEIVSSHQNLDQQVAAYIRSLPPNTRPDKGAPDGLRLDNFNQEYCFYFLCVLSTDEVSGIQFTDGEVAGLQQIPVTAFFGTSKAEMTDSTLTLIEGVPDLAQCIELECRRWKDRGSVAAS